MKLYLEWLLLYLRESHSQGEGIRHVQQRVSKRQTVLHLAKANPGGEVTIINVKTFSCSQSQIIYNILILDVTTDNIIAKKNMGTIGISSASQQNVSFGNNLRLGLTLNKD